MTISESNALTYQLKLPKPNPPHTEIRYKPTIKVDQCPSCRRRSFALFEKVVSQGVNLEYAICRWCGLVFLPLRFSDDDLNVFYREEYRKANSGDAAPILFSIEEQKLRARYLKDTVISQLKTIRSHLDVGCSTGELLFAVRSAYPEIKSVGIEPSNAYRERCIQNGLEVYATIDDLKASNPECFYFVSMSHVLEHIPNPVEYLSMIKTDLLCSNGFLLLEVPNLLGHSSYEVSHLTCFYEKTIRDVLWLSGYKVVHLKKHGIPRALEHVQRNLTILAIPHSLSFPHTGVRPILWWPFLKLQRLKGLTRYSWLKFIGRVLLKGPHYIFDWIKATTTK